MFFGSFSRDAFDAAAFDGDIIGELGHVGAFDHNAFHRAAFDCDDALPFFGGVGHFLYEREMARKLAAITRNPPRPVDRRTAPQFQPFPRPYSAPIAPAPDMAAIQDQRMAAQAAAVQASKKRRELEAILLLSS